MIIYCRFHDQLIILPYCTYSTIRMN